MVSRRAWFLALMVVFVAASVGMAGSFQEAPMLAEMVASGELPPVEERLPDPDHLYVVTPNESVGTYGGTIRVVTMSPTGDGDDNMLASPSSLVKPSADGSEIIPEVAYAVESSDDTTVWTVHLRRGMKWSDGHPFTADDIMFWYNDILMNDDLTPVVSAVYRVDGEIMEAVKVDDYTVEFRFIGPNPFFGNLLVHQSITAVFKPKHFLSQFHPNYVPEDELMAMVEAEGFETWYQLFGAKNLYRYALPLVDGLPGVGPWVLSHMTADRRVFVRNPYYYKVDTAGNQLPYIDRIETEIISDTEVAQGMIMSGQIDFSAMQTNVANFPMYRQNEDAGNYRTVLWQTGLGSEILYMVNMTHEDPVMREIFQDFRYRKALSLGINRDELNDIIFFGRAEPRQHTLVESSRYFEPEFRDAYIEFDPDRANELLDEMGLDRRDGEGYRLRPDGQRMSYTIEYFAWIPPWTSNVELVSQYWQELGLDIRVREVSGELIAQRGPANLLDAGLWTGDKATDILFPVSAQFLVPWAPGWERTKWPLWGRYIHTGGEAGEEPPAQIVELHGWWEELMKEPDEERQIELGKKILRSQAENLWTIGTVGNAPHPIIVSQDLRNFPDEGFWNWDVIFSTGRDLCQLYFDR